MVGRTLLVSAASVFLWYFLQFGRWGQTLARTGGTRVRIPALVTSGALYQASLLKSRPWAKRNGLIVSALLARLDNAVWPRTHVCPSATDLIVLGPGSIVYYFWDG